MMVLAVDNRDRGAGMCKPARYRQAAETRADDDHTWLCVTPVG